MALFAIKDAIDLKLTPLKESVAATTINYLNDCQIQLDSEQVYATKKGDNYISFSAGRTGTLTMNCEVLDEQFLALMLGGVYNASDKSIKVSSDIPTMAFSAEGTFRVTESGSERYKKIIFYNLKAQATADLTLSASEVSSFSLVLDILADDQKRIMDITDTTSAIGAKVSEPEVVKIRQEKKEDK